MKILNILEDNINDRYIDMVVDTRLKKAVSSSTPPTRFMPSGATR